MKIDPALFTTTEFATARDKAKFVDQFIRFEKNGFKPASFTQVLYKRLMYMFGHIAHYNRLGFAETWFRNNAAKYAFVRNMLGDEYGEGCPSHASAGWADVEKYLIAHARKHGWADRWRDAAGLEEDQAGRAELRRLQDRYGLRPAVSSAGRSAP